MLVHQDRLKRLMKAAMASGATRHSLVHLEWDVSGRCQASKLIELESRPPERRKHKGMVDWSQPVGREVQNGSSRFVYPGVGTPGDGIPLFLTLHVRCRKCPACLRQRAALWSSRALAETKASQRTWFGTLTLSPEMQYKFQCQAVLKAERRQVKWNELSEDEQFSRRVAAIYTEVAKYLKRVRFHSGANLRFICVAEKHASGDPHLHMLVHEVAGGVTKRQLSVNWVLGHDKWRLVDQSEPRAATYLCKYLSKEASAKVRASLRYGEPKSELPSLRIDGRGIPAALTSEMERDASSGSDVVMAPAPLQGAKTRPPPDNAVKRLGAQHADKGFVAGWD